MYIYRLKAALPAVARGQDGHTKLITLRSGTIVHRVDLGPMLPHSGLVDVTVEGETLSAFAQDLESRAERIDARAARANS